MWPIVSPSDRSVLVCGRAEGCTLTPVVQDVIAERRRLHALDDSAFVDAGGDLPKLLGIAGSPAVPDGVGVQRARVEGIASVAQDGEALRHGRPVTLIGRLVLPNENAEPIDRLRHHGLKRPRRTDVRPRTTEGLGVLG